MKHVGARIVDRAVKINDFLHKVLHTFYYDFQQKFVTVTRSKVLPPMGTQEKQPGIRKPFKVQVTCMYNI
jgi:hypothetical protein